MFNPPEANVTWGYHFVYLKNKILLKEVQRPYLQDVKVDKIDGIKVCQLSTRITEAFKITGMYDQYFDIPRYKQWLADNTDSPQMSLFDKKFKLCIKGHNLSKVIFGDFVFCPKCETIRCSGCGNVATGSYEKVSKHFGIQILDLSYLLGIPENIFFREPKCRGGVFK